MSASVGLELARLLGGARRQELVECLPAPRESLENERAFRVEQPTRLADTERASAAIRATPAQPMVWVRRLLGRQVLGPEQQHLGHVRDVVARQLPDGIGTVVTGLIADAGGRRWFAPAATVQD